MLRFPIAGTSDVYYVEYRQPFGFDSFRTTDPVANGVLIRRVTIRRRGVLQTKLIDNVPGTTSFTDAALGVGKTFTDATAKVSFTLTARTATAATVQVAFDGPVIPPSACAAGEAELNGHCYFLTTSAQTFSRRPGDVRGARQRLECGVARNRRRKRLLEPARRARPSIG